MGLIGPSAGATGTSIAGSQTVIPQSDGLYRSILSAFGLANSERNDLDIPLELHPRVRHKVIEHGDMLKAQALASKAVGEGAILPLSEIMRTALDRTPGTLMSLNLSKTANQTWVYSLVILRDDGIYSQLTIDAKENRVIEVK